ncbi:cation:proton antiporter domain-containing protein [Arenibaculum pallidiluteum]|uniref:cation:proton antiporter domain-containing protein n=1 Tax=Arenibaculum pallidiluteum TaxID=2812559 RepID=UPI001A978072|nr:cation:proton antiporter [Arenibaculum pallidiluteum]
MSETNQLALTLAAIGPLLVVAGFLRLPPSILLFAAGASTAWLPGLPAMRVEPDLVLGLFLPPIIYASTARVSFHLLRFTLVTGLLAGVLLAFATIAAVALASHTLLPGLSWPGAVLIGIIAAVFDTRAFHEAKGRPQVPRAVADALKTREMASRIVVVSSFPVAVQALTEAPSAAAVLGSYAWDVVGGAAAGLAIGWLVQRLRDRVDAAPVEIAVSLATPYLGAVAARELGLSMVVVVITAALVVSTVRIDRRTGRSASSTEARINAVAFWEAASLLVSSMLFLMAGRALPEAVSALDDRPVWLVLGAAAAALAAVLGIQYVTSLSTTLASPVAEALEPRRGRTHSGAAGMMAWASTRSVIGLVLALSLPMELPGGQSFAERDLVLVMAALIVVCSVVVQGVTLRIVVRRAGLADEDEERCEKDLARRALGDAGAGVVTGERLDAARRALLALREENRIGDEVLRGMLREVDLRARAAEGGPLPGGGPPKP